MRGLARRLRDAFAAYRTILGNPDLRRVQAAYAASIGAEWATTVALAVFAYDAGGAFAVGIVGLIRMLPAAAATPFAALVSDRYRRERVPLAIALSAGLTLALMAAAAAVDAGVAPVYALAAVLAVLSTLMRPAVSALLPSLARTPDELLAVNGVSLTTESLATLAGPVLAGVGVAAADPSVVFAGAAAISLASAALVVRLQAAQPPMPGKATSTATIRRDLAAGFRAAVGEPGPRLLIGLFTAQTVVRGALNVFIVVTTFRLLDTDASWVGYLTAALGLGGVVGAIASMTLAGRRLAAPFGLGLVLWGLPLTLLAAWPNEAAALVLIAAVGAGNSLEDVAGFTLLQRIVSDRVLARVLGVTWGLAMAGVGVGSVVAPALISGLGTRGALAVVGCFLPLLVLLAASRLAAIDRAASAPLAKLSALEAVPMFAPLSVVAKEQVAAGLLPIAAPAGTEIVREGEVGDRFYIVVDGELDVTQSGRRIRTVGPGDYFGEIALLRSVPRTATVTAATPVQLYALERDQFLASVTGHTVGLEAAEAVVEERLRSSEQVPTGRD